MEQESLKSKKGRCWFLPLGGMAEDCQRFHKRLAELFSNKSYATAMSWIRAKVSFGILRSALLCFRVSRSARARKTYKTAREKSLGDRH